MSKLIRIHFGWLIFMLVALGPAVISGQVSTGDASQATGVPAAMVAQPNPQNPQAISQTGLLPVFAVEMNFDPSWVDGGDVPSKSANFAHSGVNDNFQNAWDLIKSGGFNAVRFSLDLEDPHSASRLANLCIWAKANNVLLIPVLEKGKASDADGALLTALVASLRGGDGSNFAAYTQIAYFQLERAANRGHAHAQAGSDAQKALFSSIDALRAAETQALQGTSVQATPMMVSLSYDFELLQQGAAPGIALDPATEQKAQSALIADLAPLVAEANVDAIDVSWFPRSISSGDEGHFEALLRALLSAAPGKQLVLTTGFSTAFNPAAQQNQFLAVTMTNLWDLRVSTGGTNSHFLGAIFEQGLQGAKASVAAPAGSSDPSQWNWSDKARQLAEWWKGGKAPEDLKWWLEKTEANMGLISSPAAGGTSFTPLAGLQTFQQISTTFAQAAQNIAPAVGPSAMPSAGSAVPGIGGTATSTTGSSSGAVTNYAPAVQFAAQPGMQVTGTANVAVPQGPGNSSPSPYQQMLMTLVLQVTPQITAALITKMTGTPAAAVQSQYPAYPQGANNVMPANYGTSSSFTQPGSAPGVVSPGIAGAGIAPGSISLGPQDVTVDTPNAVAGQAVHITAQVHNGNPSQDISGLTAQLVDPTNPAAAAQNMQPGILVPHMGATPVQFAWLAPQTTSAVQLTVQILDPAGNPLASAPVPTIAVGNTATMNTAMVNLPAAGVVPNLPPGGVPMNSLAGSTTVTTPPNVAVPGAPASNSLPPAAGTNGNSSTGGTTGGSSSTTTTSTSTNSSGQPAASGSSANGTSTATAPSIAFFGPTNLRGQGTTFYVQVVNQSSAAMSSVQAQIYVDGTASQTVQLGALVPQQSRSVIFDQATVSASSQTVKVIVTTDTGASDTASAPAHSKRSQGQDGSRNGLVANRLVRSGLPPSFNIGSVSTSTGSSSQGSAPAGAAASAGNSSGTQAGANTATDAAGTQASASSAAVRTRGSKTRGIPSAQGSGASQPGSSSPSFQTAGTTQGNDQTVNTVQSPGGTRHLPQTIHPIGSGPASGQTGGAQASSGPVSTSSARTIQPLGNGPTGGSAAVPQGSPGPAPVRAVRTIQPGGASSANATPFQTARTIQPPGAMPPNNAPYSGAARGILDLSVSPADIRFSPGSKPGQIVISALIRNLGAVGANGASVLFRLMANGRQVAVSGQMAFSIQGSGMYQANWVTSAPVGQPVQLVVSVNAVGDANPANNQAAINITAPQTQTRH